MLMDKEKEAAVPENKPHKKAVERPEEEMRSPEEKSQLLNKLSLKERLYEHIHVSVRTMDRIISCLCTLLVLVIILGMIKGK